MLFIANVCWNFHASTATGLQTCGDKQRFPMKHDLCSLRQMHVGVYGVKPLKANTLQLWLEQAQNEAVESPHALSNVAAHGTGVSVTPHPNKHLQEPH
ncbi:hypothetical protein TNCV_3512861 [Trichonephila clavipes]|nr:hypothetical protein TNCV_3512861 [Trichonephila clavipes]